MFVISTSELLLSSVFTGIFNARLVKKRKRSLSSTLSTNGQLFNRRDRQGRAGGQNELPVVAKWTDNVQLAKECPTLFRKEFQCRTESFFQASIDVLLSTSSIGIEEREREIRK